MTVKNWRPAAAIALVLATALPSAAQAHAIIVESAPASGASVAAETPVLLRFNSRIDKDRSRLTLIGPGGESVTLPILDGGGPEEVTARLGALPPGAWTLRWQVLAVDGHMTRGDIRFRVAAP